MHKAVRGKITRRGDSYLRGLLIHAAGTLLNAALRKQTAQPEKLSRLQHWMIGIHQRSGYAKAKVAIANKHARQAWAMLARGEAYNSEAWQAWQAAHGEVQQADHPQDDLPTTAFATASV